MWGKLLKEITKFVVKNWYYIIPAITTGAKKLYDKIKKKKKDSSDK